MHSCFALNEIDHLSQHNLWHEEIGLKELSNQADFFMFVCGLVVKGNQKTAINENSRYWHSRRSSCRLLWQ